MSNYNRGWDLAEPKYKGLRNQGSTCYLNSVLQVLFMTKEFRDALQMPMQDPTPMYKFIAFVQNESESSYINAQLNNLFLQLKTSSPTTPTTEYIICKLGIENVWKQHDAAQYFEKILSLASPAASQVFHGRLIQRTSCSCGVSTDEHNSFWTLNLPINNTHNGVYNVEDGLKQFFSQSKLTGGNQVYCDECEAKADTTTECEVELYPKVLVLLLKRFEFCYYEMDYVKNNCPVDVPLNIDIPKGVSYELYATVDHVGDLRGGHYTATIQPPDDGGSWYDFDDSMVTPKNNFNPERSQNGYLLFYRKRERQMSDSPQEHHHGSSVDPVESETILNSDVPEGGEVTGGDDVRAGVDVPEGGEVTGGDDVRAGVDVPEGGEVTGGDDVRAGVDDPERGEVTGGDVVAGDPQTLESARLDGKGGERIKRDEELPTNEMDSRKPGDQAGQLEASSTAPTASDPEGVVTERWRGEEGQTEGGVIQKTDDGNADHDSDGDDHHTTPSSSEPMVKQPVSAGSSDVTGGDDAMECGDVGAGDEVGAGDPLLRESERLDGKGGERMTTGVEVPTNEKESREPGDQAVQQEASGTIPKVSDPESGVNERRRGPRESMELMEVCEEGETEGGVIQKKSRKVFDIPNCFSGLCLRSRSRLAKRKQRLGSKVDMVKDKKSIKKRRKKNGIICINKQTSDTE